MAETDVLGSDFLVQAGCKDDATLEQTGEDVGRDEAVGEIHGGHAVGLVLGLGGELGETEVLDGGLDAVRDLGVDGEALGHGTGGDLGQAGVQGVDELGGRGGEVGGLEVLVVLHDGEPVEDGGVVRGGRGLAGLDTLDGPARPHQDAETRRAANGLLAAGQDNVDVPLVEADFLAADAAHAVHGDQGIGADAADELGDALDVVEDTGRGVSVGEGDQLVGLLLEGFLDLRVGGAITDGRLQLGDVCAVGLQAGGVGVAEVAGVEDESVLALLDQVGRDHVPAEGTGARDDERLGSGVGRLEELPDELQGLAEGLDEARADMALAVRR